jgi:hypothetical protein
MEATLLTMKPGFNGQAAIEQLKTDLAETIAARDSTAAALESARSVDETQTKAMIASLEGGISKVNSEIVDRLADGKGAEELKIQKAELTQRIAAQRGRLAERQQLVQLEAAAETARRELYAAVSQAIPDLESQIAEEVMGQVRLVAALAKEQDNFKSGLDRLCGRAVPFLPKYYEVASQGRDSLRDELYGASVVLTRLGKDMEIHCRSGSMRETQKQQARAAGVVA